MSIDLESSENPSAGPSLHRRTRLRTPLHRPSVLKSTELCGFAARSSGIRRDENPHLGAVSLPLTSVTEHERRSVLAQAWWRGWDRADRDLS